MNHEEYEQAARYWEERADEAARMPAEELRAEVDGFLSAHNTCALACASGDLVRCTPLEYAWREGRVWIFSEGGLKFRALEANPHVCLAVFEPYTGFGKLTSVQLTGTARVVDPDDPRFAQAAAAKGIEGAALERVKGMIHLIEVTPTCADYLCSALKERGFDVRQHLDW